jgi:hypothetical protein
VRSGGRSSSAWPHRSEADGGTLSTAACVEPEPASLSSDTDLGDTDTGVGTQVDAWQSMTTAAPNRSL